ncbi:hypothetical protein PAECIP112173_05041 [Paenibacillus sp. JJ-100]|nr:hypothetical protein PAECIP112173_05041 [Paenibacillus sp. JJ-100]
MLLIARLLHLLVHRIILKSNDVVNQVLLLYATGLNFIQGIVIVAPRIQCPFLELHHQIREQGVRITCDADRHGIDEQPDHRLNAWNFSRSPSHNAAEYGIVCPVIFLQHHAPSSLEQRIDRNRSLFRHPIHPFTQVLAKLCSDMISNEPAVQYSFLLTRKYNLPFITFQECCPIVLCRLIILFIQPLDISTIFRTRISSNLFAGCQS